MTTLFLLICLAQNHPPGRSVVGSVETINNEVNGFRSLHRNIRVKDYKTGESHDFYFYGTNIFDSAYKFEDLPEGSWVKATKTPVEKDYIEVIDTFDDERMALAQEGNLASFISYNPYRGLTPEQRKRLYNLGNSRKQTDRHKIMQELVDTKDYRVIIWAMNSKDYEARFLAQIAFDDLTINKYRRKP